MPPVTKRGILAEGSEYEPVHNKLGISSSSLRLQVSLCCSWQAWCECSCEIDLRCGSSHCNQKRHLLHLQSCICALGIAGCFDRYCCYPEFHVALCAGSFDHGTSLGAGVALPHSLSLQPSPRRGSPAQTMKRLPSAVPLSTCHLVRLLLSLLFLFTQNYCLASNKL